MPSVSESPKTGYQQLPLEEQDELEPSPASRSPNFNRQQPQDYGSNDENGEVGEATHDVHAFEVEVANAFEGRVFTELALILSLKYVI